MAGFLEFAPDASLVVDGEGRVVIVNRQTERMFGYSRDELLGKPVETFLPERFRKAHVERRAGYYSNPRTRPMGSGLQVTGRRKDGSEFPVEIALGPWQTAEGLLVTCAVRDITERKRTEEELRLLQTITLAVGEAEDIHAAVGVALRKVCEATGWVCGEVWLPRSDGTVLDCAQAWHSGAEGLDNFRKVSQGFTFPPGIGLPGRVWSSRQAAWIRDVTLDANFPRAAAAREAGLKAGMGIHVLADHEVVAVMDFFMFDSRDKDGRLLELVSAVAAQLAPLFRRKRADDEVRRLNEELEGRVVERTAQLEEANKELQAFCYSVSHDLRAPLRHVIGFTDLLQAGAAPTLDEKGRHYLTTIADSAKRMGGLIDHLLTFSRLGRAEMQRGAVNLEQTVREALGELRPEMEGRDIAWKIAPLPEVPGDSCLLRLAWINLISNALKYTRTRAQAEIEIGCDASQDNESVFFIRDNGVGFDMRYVDKLFRVFQRLHHTTDFEGTGIGLANVRRIVHRHGGRAWAEGTVDGGATFYVALPKSHAGGPNGASMTTRRHGAEGNEP